MSNESQDIIFDMLVMSFKHKSVKLSKINEILSVSQQTNQITN